MPLRLALLVLAALLLTAAPTRAASFDCARAASLFETTICEAEALGAADEVLSVAYATALGGLSATAEQRLRASQRDWLAFAEAACLIDTAPGPVAARGDCLLALFDDRIAALEQSRMIGGHRFFIETLYAAMLDPFYNDEPDSPWRTGTHEIVLPRLDGTAAGPAFNAAINAYLAEAGVNLGPVLPQEDLSADTRYTLRVHEVAGRRISLEETGFWYGHGAAHGNYTISYVHYLIDAERLMTAGDIFAGKGWENRLHRLAVDALAARHADILFEGFERDIKDIVADPRRWRFDEDGLAIRFQPYEVAPYASGAPLATIPWEALAEIMAPTADAIRWGY